MSSGLGRSGSWMASGNVGAAMARRLAAHNSAHAGLGVGGGSGGFALVACAHGAPDLAKAALIEHGDRDDSTAVVSAKAAAPR